MEKNCQVKMAPTSWINHSSELDQDHLLYKNGTNCRQKNGIAANNTTPFCVTSADGIVDDHHPIVSSTKKTTLNNLKNGANKNTDDKDDASCMLVTGSGSNNNNNNNNSNNRNNKNNDNVDDNSNNYEEEILLCGLGPCTPKWLQVFASKQAFLVTFCLTWVLQGMFSTYFVSVITTIEKVFQLQSKMTGMIMSATEIGQISCTLLFTYYGGQGHRPRWIASGMVLFALSAFACSLPHFIFDNTNDNVIISSSSSSSSNGKMDVVTVDKSYVDNFINSKINQTVHEICQTTGVSLSSNDNDNDNSGGEILSEQQYRTKTVAMIIFLISLLGVGMGQTPVYTLGISYIDDNVAGRESPLYFAITIGVRILGPALGFILGSFCTRLYKDLSVNPYIQPTDPRWVGAWWLGLVLDSTFLMLASLAMFSFPKKLKTYRSIVTTPAAVVRSRQENPRKKNPRLKDFPKTIKRLLKNDILMLRTASTVLHILPIAGLYTFLPKFLESQFRFPAYSANMAVGVGGILMMGVGIILSGVFILRYKPNAKFVAGWIALAACLYALGMAILMTVGCPMDDLAGLELHQNGSVSFISECSGHCNCDNTKFSPICGDDNRTHFSACYAGCRNVSTHGNIVEFSDCSCLINSNSSRNNENVNKSGSFKATIGYCDFKCNTFTLYILIFSVFVFIHSTSEVGSMLLTLRCVDPRDKAMALGVIQFAIGLFGNVPCSIIYGAVVDSACIVWESISGKYGSCRLYNSDLFRTSFHGTTSAIMFCAFIVDVIVWHKADNINFATDEQLPTIVTHDEELTPIAEKPLTEIKEEDDDGI